ncbi:hypothetical protein [Psychrobacillus sp. MER TA 171]|uniref:hypothetical protein n=1 Tax=Psychrobacillus sp. MER TA 171 TaxID=2939577 RepID=UPI00203EABD8|nr:hypothetical protein [Psychrobacillus sp. MER TA 171]MCM3357928.1 hypothetical protein [Psychrobacillus sp. MER TA 171]
MKSNLIILGVNHAYQLVSRDCQPAVYRAFFDRVNPDLIGIQRTPEKYARMDLQEYAYEQKEIILPYALQKGVPIFPFDWNASSNDQLLAYGINDSDQPAFFRGENSLKKFTFFSNLQEDFFYSECKEVIKQNNEWIQTKSSGEKDFARRLFQYRTYMQAMSIKSIAESHPGKTILIIVEHKHKVDIESILSNNASMEIIQPSKFGYPTNEEISQHKEVNDAYAVCSFNILGLQANHEIDMKWVEENLDTLREHDYTSEVKLLEVKLELLKETITDTEAIKRYIELEKGLNYYQRFTYTGVKDKSRIDSYFDPFGNLSVKNRLRVELGKSFYNIKQQDKVQVLKEEILSMSSLTIFQEKQLEAYWNMYISTV